MISRINLELDAVFKNIILYKGDGPKYNVNSI